jgi:hypothetical protein
MNLFKKLFCGHQWVVHSKEVYEYISKEIVPGTNHWYKPILQEQEFKDTIEILICKECGKIKKIEY